MDDGWGIANVCINLVLAGATVFLAKKTSGLAASTESMVNESKESSQRELGVQTWLHLKERFDSEEIEKARKELAEDMERYSSAYHDDVQETVLNLFEDIGTLYKQGLIHQHLAGSTFSYYACGWWECAKPYIVEERRRKGDDPSIFKDFEDFATIMKKRYPSIDKVKFLQDELNVGLRR
jgi:hypothetical protein